ncbi:MAG: asparaginase [Ilumatobacteraceae bacterium]
MVTAAAFVPVAVTSRSGMDESVHLGCGAPAHAFSLVGLARAFAALARAGGAVPVAMRAHPELVGGARRDVTDLMRGVPGLMAKDGTEGVFAAALPDGRAVALKIGDGASRARPAVMLAALERLGVDTSAAAPAMAQHVLGHGAPVGDVRSLLP